MSEIKSVKMCPNEKCQLHIDKKTFGADIECCLYMAFQKGTQTAPHGGTVPPQAGM